MEKPPVKKEWDHYPFEMMDRENVLEHVKVLNKAGHLGTSNLLVRLARLAYLGHER